MDSKFINSPPENCSEKITHCRKNQFHFLPIVITLIMSSECVNLSLNIDYHPSVCYLKCVTAHYQSGPLADD